MPILDAAEDAKERKSDDKTLDPKSIELLLAEADELIRQIKSDASEEVQEMHRQEFEKHAHNLEKIKSRVLGKSDNKGASQKDAGADSMHEAILDIVKAMHNFKKNLLNA